MSAWRRKKSNGQPEDAAGRAAPDDEAPPGDAAQSGAPADPPPEKNGDETGLAEAEAAGNAELLALRGERDALERERDELRGERDELKDALLRRRADFENYKKRVERDQRVMADDVASDIFRRLVDTADNLERALSATGGSEALRQGVLLTLRELQATLEAHEVAVVDPLGERFDPLRHQALMQEQVPGYEAGTVAEVLRKGYTYKDRLLRPALVKVASGSGTDSEGGTGDRDRTGEPGGDGGEGL